MRETLLVCTKSTEKYLSNYKRTFVVTTAPTKDILKLEGTEDNVVAIGGGAAIDTAKILSKNPIVCYPTTAAGSSVTSHSVCWDGIKKMSIKRMVPKEVHVVEEFVASLPEKIKEYTTYDVLSHCLDSLWSKNKTKESMQYVNRAMEILKGDYSNSQLIEAGNVAGKAIELCPTTILHSLSYPLTAFYKIPHGRALGYLLPRVCEHMEYDISEYISFPPILLPDIDNYAIAQEALKYNKIYDINKEINIDILVDILNKSYV